MITVVETTHLGSPIFIWPPSFFLLRGGGVILGGTKYVSLTNLSMIKVKKVQNLRWDDPGKFHNTASCVFCSKGIVEYTFFRNHKRHLCVSFKLFIFPKFMDCLKLRELMKVYESLKLFLTKNCVISLSHSLFMPSMWDISMFPLPSVVAGM